MHKKLQVQNFVPEKSTLEFEEKEKNMKRCSISLLIREMKIEITMRYHLIPNRTAIIKKTKIISTGENVQKRKSSCTVSGNIN